MIVLTNNGTAFETVDGKPIQNPVKAIRAFCIDCCGGSSNEVKLCTAPNCVLYPFRLGRNPFRTKRIMTDEQRAAATERLAKARQNKQNA